MKLLKCFFLLSLILKSQAIFSLEGNNSIKNINSLCFIKIGCSNSSLELSSKNERSNASNTKVLSVEKNMNSFSNQNDDNEKSKENEPTKDNNLKIKKVNITNTNPSDKLNDKKLKSEDSCSCSSLFVIFISYLVFLTFILLIIWSSNRKLNIRVKYLEKYHFYSKEGGLNEGNKSADNFNKDQQDEFTSYASRPTDIYGRISDTVMSLFTPKGNWLIVEGTVIGKSHITQEKPCQDSFKIARIDNQWGVAVICDGAGSAKLSQIGSKWIAEYSANLFKERIVQLSWNKVSSFPGESEWKNLAKETLKKIHDKANDLANQYQCRLEDLACTIIVIVYSPIGLLITHIGDGRAGYCDKTFKWHSCLTPHKGEESNQTIFITSKHWLKENLITSGINVPESIVISEEPLAFTLMSDGCESHIFECSKFDYSRNLWSDPNQPSDKLLNSLVNTIRGEMNEGSNKAEINNKWVQYLKNGNKGLNDELDDKTMILGIYL